MDESENSFGSLDETSRKGGSMHILSTRRELVEAAQDHVQRTGQSAKDTTDWILDNYSLSEELDRSLRWQGANATISQSFNRNPKVTTNGNMENQEGFQEDSPVIEGNGSQKRSEKMPPRRRSMGVHVPSLKQRFQFLNWKYDISDTMKENFEMEPEDVKYLRDEIFQPRMEGYLVKMKWADRQIELMEEHNVEKVKDLPESALQELDDMLREESVTD